MLPWVLSCLKTALYMQQVMCPQCYFGCSREPEYSGYLAPNPGQPSAALTLYLDGHCFNGIFKKISENSKGIKTKYFI